MYSTTTGLAALNTTSFRFMLPTHLTEKQMSLLGVTLKSFRSDAQSGVLGALSLLNDLIGHSLRHLSIGVKDHREHRTTAGL